MSSDTSTSNKRIAKNTVLLYGRMLLLLAVSLYTSRVVLAALGVEDYGLYNVVGGIVTMFTFINQAMSNSSNRYIAYALGKGDKNNLKDIISATCLIHWIIAGIILVLAETVGLWLLNNKLVVPEGRMFAAQWVYQISIVSCLITVITVPYNAMITAHEKMGAFALFSIFDALLKLIIVFVISNSNSDRLILYAALLLLVGLFDRLIAQLFCRRNFEEAKKIRLRKVPQLREMSSFAGWSMIGNLAFIGYTEGLNILLNIFFGPAVNAARGIAVQVEGALKGFVINFQMAVTPQIIKSYAQDDLNRMHSLIYSSSKFSFFLLYCMVLPICIEADTILDIWLKDVPQYAALFTILILITSLSEPLRNPIDRANQATGNIRNYQIVEGGLLLLIVPIAYLVLKLGAKPYAVFVVQLVIMYLVQVVRLFLVCGKINMSKREYIKCVFYRISVVAILAAIIPILLHNVLPQSVLSSVIVIIVSVISVLACSYSMGLTVSERIFINQKIVEYKNKIKNK